jgi:hypothetical protein
MQQLASILPDVALTKNRVTCNQQIGPSPHYIVNGRKINPAVDFNTESKSA